MKTVIGLILFLFLMAGCASSSPEIIDNGNPGKIKVIVFLDANKNGAMDQDETRLVDKVAIGQDISCPVANNEFIQVDTDTRGEALYEDLEPGNYCVMYMGRRGATTKLAVEVHLSSDQEAQIVFGLTAE